MKTTATVAPLLAALLLTSAHAQPEGPPPKYAVLPFAALSGEVPQRAGIKAAAMLQSELRNAEGVEVVESGRDRLGEGAVEPLAGARAKVQEALSLRAKRKFRAAEEAVDEALGDYRAHAATITDIAEVQDAWALLAALRYNTGRDEEGERALRAAVALAPGRELPLAKTSALFGRVVLETRKALQGGAKGELLIESIPPAAVAWVDGVPLGSTPLRVKDVPAGGHYWRVQLPSGEAVGGVVEVGAQKQVKVAGQSAATDPETRLLAALSQNRLDEAAAAAAKQHGQAVGADQVVFGALSPEGKILALDAFVLTAATGKVKRLPRMLFDGELLSAGMEFYNLAGRLGREGLRVATDTPVPGPVTLASRPSAGRVDEVRYGEARGAKELALDAEPVGPENAGPRTPAAPKVRTPLKRK
jgi:hypothetical protein